MAITCCRQALFLSGRETGFCWSAEKSMAETGKTGISSKMGGSLFHTPARPTCPRQQRLVFQAMAPDKIVGIVSGPQGFYGKLCYLCTQRSKNIDMKCLFSLLLLLIMTSNLAVTCVEQLRCGVVYELAEAGTDDADENGEKGKEKEKDSLSFSDHIVIRLDGFNTENLRKSLFPRNNLPHSELYAFLPELPPKV